MTLSELVAFIRAHRIAVVATVDESGSPQAAVVGVSATDEGEIVFDTLTTSRKYANVEHDPRVALVVGWDDEVTVQCEGNADIVSGPDLVRCQQAYFVQYPDGRERAGWPDIAYIRIRPSWFRYSDYRPGSFVITETEL